MATIASLQVDMTGDLSGLTRTLSTASARLEEFGKKATMIGGVMSKALTAPLVAFAGASVRAFGIQEDAERKLAAAIRATGGEVDANMTRFKAFASQLQSVTRIGDETTLRILQIATAQGLSADSAERATRNAIAMQAAFGVSADSAIRMTAALEQGDATMLRRYIPALRSVEDETLMVSKAQEILAGAFTLAEAEAQTSTGRIIQLKNSLGDLMEDIGGIVANAIQPLVASLQSAISRLQALDEVTKRNIIAYGALVAAIGPALVIFGKLSIVIAALATPLAIKIAMFAALALVINYVAQNAKAFADRFEYFFSLAANSVISATATMIEALGRLAFHFSATLGASLQIAAAALNTFKRELADPNEFTEFGSRMESITATMDIVHGAFMRFVGDLGIAKSSAEETTRSVDSLRVAMDSVAVSTQNTSRAFAQVNSTAGEMPDAIVRSQVALEVLQPITDRFVNSFGDGMANVVLQGEKLSDTLRNIGRLLASAAIQQGIKLLLSGGLSSAGSGFFGSGGGLLGAIFGGITGSPVAGTLGQVQVSGQLVAQGSQLIAVIENSKPVFR